MRSKKLKLAAVVLSAIMAAGTMPATAFAEDFDVAEVYVETEDVAEVEEALDDAVPQAEESEFYQVADEDTIKTDYEESQNRVKVTYKLRDQYGEDLTDEKVEYVTPKNKVAATYFDRAYVVVDLKLPGYEKNDVQVPYGEVLASSNKVEGAAVVVTLPTCTEEGERKFVDYVLVPGAQLGTDNKPAKTSDVISSKEYTKAAPGNYKADDFVIPATGHTWGAETVTIEVSKSEKTFTDADGKTYTAVGTKKDGDKVVLTDPAKSGSYVVVTTKKCEVCGEKEYKYEQVAVKSEIATTKNAEITAVSDNVQGVIIDDEVVDAVGLPLSDVPEDVNKFVLKDCDKEGWYQITYYTAVGYDEESFLTKKITIPAHHAGLKKVVLKNSADSVYVTVDQDKLTVKNKVCFKEVAYDIVTYCASDSHTKEKVLDRDTKTAPINEKAHSIDNALKEEITKTKNSVIDNAYVETLKDNKFVKVTDNTATCKADGTAKITFLCQLCGKEVDSITVTVKKHTADPAKPELVILEEPTCAKEGKASRIVKCKICGTVLESSEVTVEKLDHTFGTAKDDTKIEIVGNIVIGKNSYYYDHNESFDPYEKGETNIPSQVGFTGYCLTARTYHVCQKCSEKVIIDRSIYSDDIDFEIVNVNLDGKDGKSGTITVKATAYGVPYKENNVDKTQKLTTEKTVPYFVDWLAYLDRNNDSAAVDVEIKNGLVKDADDVWRLYKAGEFQKEFTGIYDYNGGKFYLKEGVLQNNANGLTLVQPSDGSAEKFYFLANGQVQTNAETAIYDGELFKLKNGELNAELNGLSDYNGGTFLFTTGKLRKDVSGLWLNPADNVWYYLSQGQVQNQFSGATDYQGEWFIVKEGKLDSSYNGPYDFQGTTFNVVNGQLYPQAA